ncbi:MAG: hypothetical protein IT376_21760 [Polyangiaceae bacterium]|nr:hypothetical protein [Polyangiaceae bacterium]
MRVAPFAFVALSGTVAPALVGAATPARVGPSRFVRIDEAERRGELSAAVASLRRVQAVRAPERLPAALEAEPGAGPHELSDLLRLAALRRGALAPPLAAELRDLLARPTDASDPFAWSVTPEPAYCTEHFCLHWVASGPDAPPLFDPDGDGVPKFIIDAGDQFETAWRALTAIGYSYHGVDDGGLGGDTRIDVYVKDAGGDFAAAVFPEDFVESSPVRFSSWVMLNASVLDIFPPAYVAEVIAHELKHTFDAATFGNAPSWLFESSATWVENEVYDDASYYYPFLECWFGFPEFSLDVTRYDEYPTEQRASYACAAQPTHIYGSSTFWFHATARFGLGIQRDTWDQGGVACAAETDPDGPSARRCVMDVIDQLLAAHGESLEAVFAQMAFENAVPRASPALLSIETPGELADWPAAAWVDAKHYAYPVDETVELAHLSARYVDFRPPSGRRGTVRITVDGPDAFAFAAAIQLVPPTGPRVEQPLVLDPATRTASAEVSGLGSQWSRVALILVNPSRIETDSMSDGLAARYQASFEPETVTPIDAGAPPPVDAGGAPAEGGAPAAQAEGGGGCACGVPATHERAWGALPALGLAAALRARSRRRRRG